MAFEIALFAGASIALLLALGQLFVRKRTPANLMLFSLLILCCIVLTHGTWYAINAATDFAHWNKTYLPILCMCGPVWYLYNRCLFDGYELERKTLLHCIPSGVCVLLSIPFYLQSVEFKITYVEVNVYDFTTLSIYIATRIAELTLITYLVLTVLFLKKVRDKPQSKSNIDPKAVNLLLALTAVAVLTAVIRVIGAVLDAKTFSVVIPCGMASVLLVILYCYSHRHPNLLSLGLTAPKERKTPPCENAVLESYRQKIEQEEWFLDPDIKVQRLARLLSTQPNRLSELINTATGTNFNGFINDFRINHAKRVLLEQPNLSILDVAYASGFNSKSAFYKHFTQLTSTTPSDFRKNGFSESLKAA